MGDISRHRDVFLNSKRALPKALLSRLGLQSELTYLELGNYFTDVSQFRDPVVYIFAKRKIWHEGVLSSLQDIGQTAAIVLGVIGARIALEGAKKVGAITAAAGALPLLIPKGLVADLLKFDNWLDRLLGKPVELRPGKGPVRESEDFGELGQFFESFTEGITHFLFAADVPERAAGAWRQIDAIPSADLERVNEEFFTQYFPHEHTDQPPYVWDASLRPRHPKLYGPSRRQRSSSTPGGVVNVVDRHYVQYLAEGLSKLEKEWRGIPPDDVAAKRRWLVRLGKLLHGVEDWYFHSNAVEMLRLLDHGRMNGESDKKFAERFARKIPAGKLEHRDPARRKEPELQIPEVERRRRLWRRLHSPVYHRGDKRRSAGIPSEKKSELTLGLAYTAFPSAEDTASTLLGALEALQEQLTDKVDSGGGGVSSIGDIFKLVLAFREGSDEDKKLFEDKLRARGLSPTSFARGFREPPGPDRERSKLAAFDCLREWAPLFLTLLHESERQRLVADVTPMAWPLPADAKDSERVGKEKRELEAQKERHEAALKPRERRNGAKLSHYAFLAHALKDQGRVNVRGRDALLRAFEVDRKSEKSHPYAPGPGGFLLELAWELQGKRDKGHRRTKALNGEGTIVDPATNNGAINEIIGSHSLMSKDTFQALPFFDDATTLASIASLSVLQLMLEEVASPAQATGIHWQRVLWKFIRFPRKSGGWEREALGQFERNGQIPELAKLQKLTALKSFRIGGETLRKWQEGTHATELERRYAALEKQLSTYRHS